MRPEHYRKHLEEKPLKLLKKKYEEIFMVSPPSKYRKPDIIKKLYEKFCELQGECEEPALVNNVPESKPEPTEKPVNNHRKVNGKKSRRSMIIEELQFNFWDLHTLAERLNLYNPQWTEDKNKTAISGTIADMRKNHGWVVIIDKKGRICKRR